MIFMLYKTFDFFIPSMEPLVDTSLFFIPSIPNLATFSALASVLKASLPGNTGVAG